MLHQHGLTDILLKNMGPSKVTMPVPQQVSTKPRNAPHKYNNERTAKKNSINNNTIVFIVESK